MQLPAPTMARSSSRSVRGTGAGPWARSLPSASWGPVSTLVQHLVRGQGEEVDELAEDQGVEQLHGVLHAASRRKLPQPLLAELLVQLLGEGPPVVELGAVLELLPELGAGDLGGGGVFHQ